MGWARQGAGKALGGVTSELGAAKRRVGVHTLRGPGDPKSPPPSPSLLPSHYSGDDTQLLRTPGIAHRSEIKTAQRLKFWLNLCSNHMATKSPIHDYVICMDNKMTFH